MDQFYGGRPKAIQDAIKRLDERKAKEAEAAAKEATDKAPARGRRRKHPSGKPKPTDQENFTDLDSRIMKVGSGAFEQCYNAQAAVDSEAQIIVGVDVTQNAADNGQLLPLLDLAEKNTGAAAAIVLADAGYRSEQNFQQLEDRGVRGFISLGREGKKTAAPNPKYVATNRMRRKLSSKRGRRRYRERKHIVEPVFGWIKNVLGFRAFSLRGHQKVRGEWALVCLAMKLRRMQGAMAWT